MHNKSIKLTKIAIGTAILSESVVYGTDMFFAIVGRRALAQSSEASLTDVMGHFHETADARMPVFGGLGIIGSLVAGLTGRGKRRQLSLMAVVAQLVYLGLYNALSKPINTQLVAAAKAGQTVPNAHELQRSWDRVVLIRASLLSFTLISLIAANWQDGLED